MSSLPFRLGLRLALVQGLVHAVTFMVTALFVPRVLLLEPAAASAAVGVLFVLGGFAVVSATVSSLLATRRVERPLSSLVAQGGATGSFFEVSPEEILAIHAMPARLALGSLALVLLAALATLAPGVRPQILDTSTELGLVLLVVTMASVAALPAYVMMRAAVTAVLERAAPATAHEALALLGRAALGRVRVRLVAAVATPVMFVALGATLLVAAHLRGYERGARIADAVDVVRAVFDPLPVDETRFRPKGADDRARAEALAAARGAGLGVRLEEAEAPDDRVVVTRDDEGGTLVSVPLRAGTALVSFEDPQLTPMTFAYLALAALALALAALLGTRIGVAFDADIALATRAVRRAGVAEVMRGTIILDDARFLRVRELLEEIDALGGVFRRFASVQERAIDAREGAERMRALLLASMSHDLKAPLNAVLGFAEIVGQGRLSEGQRESLAIITQRGRELLALIDTILDSARAEAGELQLTLVETRIEDVVMSSVLEARDLAPTAHVQITGETQTDMPTMMVDATRLVQGLTAVVLTAVRFGGEDVVPVRASLPGSGERLRIEVETRGEGLPEAERAKLFDAFASAASARRHGGLGLGLQLARAIVALHGGEIEVDDKHSAGLVFRVWVPVVRPHR